MSRRSSRGAAAHVAGISFGAEELRDLGVAWLALSVAFAILFAGGGGGTARLLASDPLEALSLVGISLVTAGLAFLLHELAHKVLAVRFGQVAEFRAEYGMLFLAVVSAMAGFIFAAPGAVHHAGRLTDRERGLIALAGPATNVVLAVPFVLPLVAGAATDSDSLFMIGVYGVAINVLLAGFNMLPVGPLDGASVRDWSIPVYVATAVPMILLGAGSILFLI